MDCGKSCGTERRCLGEVVALQRGPVVYCLEEKDNGADLHLLWVDPTKQPVSF